MKSKKWIVFAIACVLVMPIFIGTGCNGCQKEGPAEKAGEKVDEAVEESADALEEAADKMEDTVDDAVK